MKPSRRHPWLQSSAVLALAACLLATSGPPAFAARFGVPDAAGDPPGWFILTGPQVPTGLGNLSWGDRRHGLDLFVEVTAAWITVEIFDPGLVGADPAGLDAFFNGTVGQATYRLFDPTGALLAEQSYGSDTALTNRALVPLFDGPTMPGLHRIEARMDDTATADQDINVFGLSVPGYGLFSYSFTGGEVNLSGATITQPLVVWPWLVHSTPTLLAGEPITGVDIATWDLDSATRPPNVRLDTARGRGADLLPSPDSGLFVTNLRGIDVGHLDCSDYGLYRLSVDRIEAGREGNNDANVFTAQLYDYDAGVQPADFPIAAADPRRPVRLYYPRDDGSPPLKESLSQTASIVAGRDPPSPGFASDVELRIELSNPTDYELTVTDLVARIATDPQLGPPTLTFALPTLVPTLLGQEVRVTGVVPAGEVGVVTVLVTYTPNAVGTSWLTGDGLDLQGGTLPTEAVYATPFEAGARLGPVCALRVDAVTPTCQARAVIDGNLNICEGEFVRLGGGDSNLVDCAGDIEYRWLRDGLELFGWPGPASIMDAPSVDTAYDLEVRCDALPSCADSSAVTVRVEPDVPPAPVDDSLRMRKEFAGLRFTWTANGSPAYHLRSHADRRFDRPTSVLVANVVTGEHFLVATPPLPFRVSYYQVFAANCAGTENP